MPNRQQHLAGNRDAFGAGGFGGTARAMRSRIESGTETRSSLRMNSALRTLVSGQMPASTGMRQCSTRRRKFSSRRMSKTGCVTAYCAPASHFEFEAAHLFVEVGDAGIGADADDEGGGGADGVGADVHAEVQIVTMLTRPMASTSKTAVASG